MGQSMQPPVCIAAANGIINRMNEQNVWRHQQGKPKIRYQIERVQLLLYFAKLVWLCDYPDCEMIPETFWSYASPRIMALYEYWPCWSDGDMYSKTNEETRPLTEAEANFINAFVDTTIDISTYALEDYANHKNGPAQVSYKAGVDVTKETMLCYLHHKNNQEKLLHFLKTGKAGMLHAQNLRNNQRSSKEDI